MTKLFACCATFTLALVAALTSAKAESGEADCTGIGFDAKRPMVVAKVTAKPRAHFVKGPFNNDASCPADTEICRQKAYLVTGDLVLTGRTRGPYTCVAYQAPKDKKQNWTRGWISSAALEPVAPLASAKPSDWIGTWKHTGGEITIERAKNGKLVIGGEQVYAAAQNVHTGVIGAEVKPDGSYLTFAEDGTTDFDKASDGDCQVRMHRVGQFLAVEDNGQCGGVMVTFTGLYRRQ